MIGPYPGWFSRGACYGADAGVFYPLADDEYSSDRKKREEEAKAVCKVCPVKISCRTWACGIYGSDVQAGGVWGGMNEAERNEYRRRHLKQGQVAA